MNSQGITIEIKTVADLRAAKEVESELRRQIISAKAAGLEYANLEKRLSAVRTAINNKGVVGRAGSELLGMAEKLPVVGSVMRSLNGAVGLASTAFVGLGVAAGATMATLRGVIGVASFAGRMNDLGAQTGQSAREVVILDQAFRNAGLGSEAVGQSLNLLQKALTGVNEEGQPTAGVFERLGLSISDLKSMSASEALAAISAKISGMKTPADQTRAAMEMFGRSGGRMLALLKDSAAFDTAKTMVGGLADSIGASVEELDKFSDSIESLDTKKLQFFAGFASGLSGDLGNAADAINKIDLTPFGTKLGFITKGIGGLAEELIKAADAIAKAADKVPDGGLTKWMMGNVTGQNVTSWASGQLNLFARAGEDLAQTERMNKFTEKTRAELAARQSGDAPEKPKTDAEVAAEKERADQQDAMDKSAKVLREGVAEREKKAKEAAVKASAEGGDVGAVDKAIAQKKFDINVLRTKRRNGYDIDPKDINTAEDDLVSLRELKKTTEEKSKKTGEENAEKRKSLDLEVQIAEAAEKGDKAAEAKLKWMKDYTGLIKQAKDAGMNDVAADALARRGANASIEKPDEKKAKDVPDAGDVARKALSVSSMARIGGAVGESMQAAGQVDLLKKQIEVAQKTAAAAELTATATREIADKETVYS